MKLRSTMLALPPVNWIPVTTVAAVVFVLLRLKMVFCESVWLGVEVDTLMPITDADEVVPVPLLLVRLRTVLLVQLACALLVNMPTTWEEAPVELSCMELATVPPTLFEVALNAREVPVFARIP